MKSMKLLTVVTALFIMTGCVLGNNFTKLETELTEKASTYYEEFLEGKLVGINKHKITLEAMETNGVDIKNFTDKNCSKDSYALITVQLDDEGVPAEEYKVENYLTCGDYQTETK